MIQELSDIALASSETRLQSKSDRLRVSKLCHLTADLATWKTPTLTIGTPHEGTIASDYPPTESHNLEGVIWRSIM